MSEKTFEACLMDLVSKEFAKEGAGWSLVHAGEDKCSLPINHIAQFIEGRYFYISLVEFILSLKGLGDASLSYTIYVADREPCVIDNTLNRGNVFIEIVWNIGDGDIPYLSKYDFKSCGHNSVSGETFDFLTSIFSRLINFTPSQ